MLHPAHASLSLHLTIAQAAERLSCPGHRPLTRAMIEPDHFDEKLAGGGSGPTICSTRLGKMLRTRLWFSSLFALKIIRIVEALIGFKNHSLARKIENHFEAAEDLTANKTIVFLARSCPLGVQRKLNGHILQREAS